MASEYMRGTVIDVVILLSPFAIFRTPAARGTSLMRSDGLRGKLQRVASVKRLSSTTFLDPKGSVLRPGRCGVCWLVDCVNDPVPDRHAGGITSDLERIEAGANHIDIHFRPTRLGPLLDVATPLPSASDDETQILPVPIRLQRAGREIAMRIDGTDPFATAKPDARLVKLLIRARRFNAALVVSDSVPFAALAKREGVSRSYFTRVVRLSYLAPHITQAILEGRQPRDLTADKLLAHSRLPLGWHEQRTVLGFA